MINLAYDLLATYRIVRFIQSDHFPAMEVLREETRENCSDYVVNLLDCPWCLSVYVAVVVVACRQLFPDQWGPIAKVLTFSAATGLIRDWPDR